MTSLTQTPRGLEIKLVIPVGEAREEFQADDNWNARFEKLIESHLGNGWAWLEPREVAALTDSPILAFDTQRDDEGELTDSGDVYWYPDYQIVDPIEVLFRDGLVVFPRAEKA